MKTSTRILLAITAVVVLAIAFLYFAKLIPAGKPQAVQGANPVIYLKPSECKAGGGFVGNDRSCPYGLTCTKIVPTETNLLNKQESCITELDRDFPNT